jgi:hypothetical protein
MMDLERLGLVGVLIGGAVPWLEAVTVIPAGILLGLSPVAVVVSAIVGNLATVAVAAFAGERVRTRFLARRRHKGEVEEAHRPSRSERVMARFGLPGLALLGPLGLGTQLSAALAVSLGVSAGRAFLWVGASTIGWSVTTALIVVWGAGLVDR